MAIEVGADNVWQQQARFLAQAQTRGASEGMLGQLLSILFEDDDIVSGRESLHPEWLRLFTENAPQLASHMEPEVFQQVSDLVSSLGTMPPGIAEIDPRAERLVFLLGAGASKPKPSSIPTVKELLPDLLTRARRLDREDLTRLADFCDESRVDNIEDLLTAAQLSDFCGRNPAAFRLMDFLLFRRVPDRERDPYLRRRATVSVDLSSVAFLQDTLQVLFGLLSSSMLPAKPNSAHESIAAHAHSNIGTAIVTTNYDCCMDIALDEKREEFSYLVEFANRHESDEGKAEATTLIKLHGSLNWFYCETCQQVYLINIRQTLDEYFKNGAPYPVIGICKDCGGQRRGLLMPPLAIKFNVAPPLNPLLERAQDAFNGADAIVVVGFSFADADLYLSRMISKSMQVSQAVKLLIFDPDPAVARKVTRQLSLRISDFERERVVWVRGDCAEMLPKFLSGSLMTEEQDGMPEPSAQTTPSA